jgi:hypothetical protein
MSPAFSGIRLFLKAVASPGWTNFYPYDVEMDASFGVALVTLNRSLRAVTLGIRRLFLFFNIP